MTRADDRHQNSGGCLPAMAATPQSHSCLYLEHHRRAPELDLDGVKPPMRSPLLIGAFGLLAALFTIS